MLQVPLEIAFHNIESSEWAEQEVRARVAELEKLYDRLVSCRVRIDQRAKDRTGAIPPVVHIELGIPGRPDLVVSHEPEHLLRKYRHPDLRKASSGSPSGNCLSSRPSAMAAPRSVTTIPRTSPSARLPRSRPSRISDF